MYKQLIKPIFFKLYPETSHHLANNSLKIVSAIPGGNAILRSLFSYKHKNLERTVFGLRFPNPVGLAAGFDKDAEVFDIYQNLGFGFIEIGTVTPKAQPGNPKPRIFRIVEDNGIINRMGFNNKGVDNAIINLKKKKKKNIIIGGNIGKNTATKNEDAIKDYTYSFKALHAYVDYFTVNVSCPNVKDLTKLQNKGDLVKILSQLQEINQQQEVQRPILLKIAPDLNQTQLDEVIEIVNETKIDGIVATNTSTNRENLKTTPQRLEEISNGGLSGKPLNKRSTEVIKYLHTKSNGKIPIIGVGGIMNAEDAIEKIEAGASLVQIYSGFIYEGPALAKKICKALVSK